MRSEAISCAVCCGQNGSSGGEGGKVQGQDGGINAEGQVLPHSGDGKTHECCVEGREGRKWCGLSRGRRGRGRRWYIRRRPIRALAQIFMLIMDGQQRRTC